MRQNQSEGGTTYSFTGYSRDEELAEAFDTFVNDSELIGSESKAVVYAIRTMLQREDYIND